MGCVMKINGVDTVAWANGFDAVVHDFTEGK